MTEATLPPDAPANDRQDRALWQLLCGRTVREAAEAAAASERTVYRWLQTPAFQNAYRLRRRARFLQGLGALQNLTERAAQTLDSVLNDQDASPASRVTAARSVLQYACQSFELDDIHSRLDELERAREDDGESFDDWN
jgi:hypothetical protein